MGKVDSKHETLKIDFSEISARMDEGISDFVFDNCSYEPAFACLSMNNNAEDISTLDFDFRYPEGMEATISFEVIIPSETAAVQNQISVFVNEQPLEKELAIVENLALVKGSRPQKLFVITLTIHLDLVRPDKNHLRLINVSDYTKLLIKSICMDFYTPIDRAHWMSYLNDDVYIGDINIPGTHDAAAIRTNYFPSDLLPITAHSLYACHKTSILQQLNSGIRILDIRLRVNVDPATNAYTFSTCHGSIGSLIRINEYEPFLTVLNTCATFLQTNPTECLIMTLKMDDWSSYENDAVNVLNALNAVLTGYPVFVGGLNSTLDDVRGRIFLLNRIDTSFRFGYPISWRENTNGSFAIDTAQNRQLNLLYVQDQFKSLQDRSEKINLVTAAFQRKQTLVPTCIVLNFASATATCGITGIYVMDAIINYIGDPLSFNCIPTDQRHRIGWILLDYEDTVYTSPTYGQMDVVAVIIDSNFGLNRYPQPFSVHAKSWVDILTE